MQSFFVYYKVQNSRELEFLPVVHALLAAVQQATGIRGELLKRSDPPKDGLQTWMEIYSGVSNANAFLSALDQIVSRSSLQALLVGQRHAEIFVRK